MASVAAAAADENTKPQAIVVMVPFPAQGHLNQLLHLSRLISSHGIPVHYAASATHSRQAKLRVHGWDLLSSSNIHFHEFPTPAFESPPPDPNDPFHFPSQLQPSFDAAPSLRLPVGLLLSSLSPTARKLVVIHDFLMSSVVQDIVSIPNGQSYVFQSVSTFLVSSFYWRVLGNPTGYDEHVEKLLPQSGTTITPALVQYNKTQSQYQHFSSGTLYNTCTEIEGPFLDVLSRLNTKQWPIGPFNPIVIDKKSDRRTNKYLDWLDQQPPNSVIFVSFGTTTSLTEEQILELAIGLERSGHKFIWVLRDADKGDIFVGDDRRSELPEGYEQERMEKGQGVVVRGWAAQLEVLAHPATGGFMSHCGWNSCLESITMGVPIATWPMHSDQPHNSVFITKVLKVGVVVKDWAKRKELVDSVTVANAVRRLMGSEEGDDVRRRAKELGAAVKKSVVEGKELRDFIAHIRS